MSAIKCLRRILPILIALLFAMSAPSCFAHGGRTDSSGGHRDTSTGDYHYHHGHPAHDHIDMDGDGDLDCPYSFTDITEHGGFSSEGTAKSVRAKSNHSEFALKVFSGAVYIFIMFVLPNLRRK